MRVFAVVSGGSRIFWGVPTPEAGASTYYFAKNYKEMEEFGSRSRGVSLAPPLHLPLVVVAIPVNGYHISGGFGGGVPVCAQTVADVHSEILNVQPSVGLSFIYMEFSAKFRSADAPMSTFPSCFWRKLTK